jgi:hypothetical protein
MIYLNLYETCKKKRWIHKIGLVIKPVVFKEMNSRCMLYFIDMQSQADRELNLFLCIMITL